MVAVLSDFGFGSLGLTLSDFLKENYVTQLGYPPLRIDILNSISGVEFDEAYANKVDGEVDDLVIPFINVAEFIKNKEATGRKKIWAILLLSKKRNRRLHIFFYIFSLAVPIHPGHYFLPAKLCFLIRLNVSGDIPK